MHFTFSLTALRQEVREVRAVVSFIMVLCLWLQSGCQMFPLERQPSPLAHVQFMDAWKTYLHCRSSDKPDEIRFDVYQLKHLVNKLISSYQAPRVLPSRIRSLFAPLPSRLSVDPREMVVACALHGGQAAESAGRPDLSRELFSSVIADQKTADFEHSLETLPRID